MLPASPLHPTHLNPRFLASYDLASCDGASNIWQALRLGKRGVLMPGAAGGGAGRHWSDAAAAVAGAADDCGARGTPGRGRLRRVHAASPGAAAAAHARHGGDAGAHACFVSAVQVAGRPVGA